MFDDGKLKNMFNSLKTIENNFSNLLESKGLKTYKTPTETHKHAI